MTAIDLNHLHTEKVCRLTQRIFYQTIYQTAYT